MKKVIITLVLAVICTALTILFLFELNAQKEQLKADATEDIYSKILDENRKLLIHLPKDYSSDPQKRYPVMYALDATSHDKDVLNATSILSLADQIPQIIIVGIVNNNRNKDLTPHYITKSDNPTDFGKGDVFLEFLENEVVPLIEKNYRTTNYRMISGHSRAGLFVLFSMIEKPSLFSAYFCYSPAFWRSNDIIAQKLESALTRMNRFDHFVYLSLGQQENAKMKQGFDKVIEVFNQSDSLGLKIFYEYTPNANHGSNAYYSLPRALKNWSDQG